MSDVEKVTAHKKPVNRALSDTPLLSVVVVAQNVENFIQQALESVAAQMWSDIELLYVDNGSTDNTLRLAQKIKDENADHAIRIIPNATNLGLGEGRNQGISLCRGEYIIFLDGDDWLQDGALRKLAQIARDNAPDLAIYNHARFFPDGHHLANRNFRSVLEGWFEGDEQRQQVLMNLNVAWNKLYRRQFILQNALQFGPGFYEDIDWNFKATLLAARIYVIPEVLVYYRQRPGSILRSVDERHFDVFQQWSNVLDFLASQPHLRQAHGATIEQYARNQMSAVLHAPDRVPESRKAEFFAEMAKLWNRFDAELERHARRRKIDTLISRNQFAAYHAFVRLVEAKRRASLRIRQLANKHVTTRATKAKNAALLSLYKNVFLKLPLNPRRVVFESYWGKKMDCNPYALFTELSKQGGYDCYWVLRDTAVDRPGFPYKRIAPGTLEYYLAIATAKYLISNVNFPTEIEKREGTVHVQTKHGTPLKLMGLDIRPVRPKEMSWSAFSARCQRWDYVLSSNSFSSKTWRRGFPYNYKILESGYPRNDIFFNSTPEKTSEIRSQLSIPPHMKIALYAPTFRDQERDAKSRIDLTRVFNPTRVLNALGPDYVLLLRSHYFMESDVAQDNPRIIDASNYIDANELCLVSDVLITDYSSIMFDYANLARPIVLYVHDYEEYMSKRGTYFDIRKNSPGPVASSESELLAILRLKQWELPENKQRMQDFRSKFCRFDDGKASIRVIKEILQS